MIRLWYPTRTAGRRSPYMPPAVARFVASSGGGPPALLEAVTLDATADAPPLKRSGGWPVVLVSPGFGVEGELYAGLVEDLASHGYIVVALAHPHDAGIVQFPDGHVVVPHSQMNIAAALVVRIADTRFVLTQLSQLDRSGPFAGMLDLGRVGMFSDLVFFVPQLMHANFATGQTVRLEVGKLDGPATLTAERAYLLAFFDRYLRGETAPLLAHVTGAFPGMRLAVGG